jgi:hypothetical protein
VDVGSGLMNNEVYSGFNICDNPPYNGWVAACDGPCDVVTCSNFLDYFEKSGVNGDPQNPPNCATFSPAPLDVSAMLNAESSTRNQFTGSGAAGQQSDWTLAPYSRD